MQLFLEFSSVDALVEEIESNLSKGRALVPGNWPVEQQQSCQLVLVHPETAEWLPLLAEAVLVGEEIGGVGLELKTENIDLAGLLRDFAEQRQTVSASARPPPTNDTPLASPASSLSPQPLRAQTDSSDALVLDLVDVEEASPESAPSPASAGASDRQSVPALSPAERVRKLDALGRDRCARRGPLADRIALERAFGSSVWEALLSNPMLTGPEVARIAKNRTINQPLLNTIVGAAGWVAKPEVRRALLSNPRLTEALAERVLRSLPFSELKLVPKQAAYPVRVRNVAKRLLPK